MALAMAAAVVTVAVAADTVVVAVVTSAAAVVTSAAAEAMVVADLVDARLMADTEAGTVVLRTTVIRAITDPLTIITAIEVVTITAIVAMVLASQQRQPA
jgi:hypothetical protein